MAFRSKSLEAKLQTKYEDLTKTVCMAEWGKLKINTASSKMHSEIKFTRLTDNLWNKTEQCKPCDEM